MKPLTIDQINALPPVIIHKSCGTESDIGWYDDGTVDYLCPKCNVTFLDNEQQTVIAYKGINK